MHPDLDLNRIYAERRAYVDCKGLAEEIARQVDQEHVEAASACTARKVGSDLTKERERIRMRLLVLV